MILRSVPLFRQLSRLPSIPLGERVYVIGDVHGRMDLVQQLLELLDAEEARRPPVTTRIIILGDFIDRGANSAKVISTLQWWQKNSTRVTVLKGNHEATLLDCLDGDPQAQRSWLEHGGLATMRSFGIFPFHGMSADDLAALMATALGDETITWLRQLPLSHQIGDYFFCHAGVKPGVPLSEQEPDDLLWIRGEFLKSKREHGAVIVHGHSMCGLSVHFAENRICVDTGAHETGVLSAVALQGPMRWTVSTPAAEKVPNRPGCQVARAAG